MPIPLLYLLAAPVVAYVGKKIYDATTEDTPNNSSRDSNDENVQEVEKAKALARKKVLEEERAKKISDFEDGFKSECANFKLAFKESLSGCVLSKEDKNFDGCDTSDVNEVNGLLSIQNQTAKPFYAKTEEGNPYHKHINNTTLSMLQQYSDIYDLKLHPGAKLKSSIEKITSIEEQNNRINSIISRVKNE